MQIKEKKLAAVLAAVEMYLEEEAAALAPPACTVQAVPASEPGAWAQFGRADMMAGRRMLQMRAISGVR